MELTKTTQKILIIDDEEDLRTILTESLRIAGYEVIEARNGLDGLAAAKMNYPDLILCDITMPKMDGLTLLSTLREEPEFAGIPFIFLTGNVGTSDRRKGMQMGADDYLTKPFTTEDLITAVETRLVKKKKLQKFYETQFDDIRSNIVNVLPHEFRTPLNGILGFSQILKDGNNPSAEEVKEMGAMIHKSGERLHHLLENMVLFGQLQLWMRDQNRIMEMRRGPGTLLSEAVHFAAERLTAFHQRDGAVRSPASNAHVQISTAHLTKIMEEIIDNALKFSKAGTDVIISSEGHGPEVHIKVRDSGRGMSEEQINKISGFQQFEREFYEQQGAGLGLVISKLLVELYGGTLSIESVENTGTTVTVSLPNELKN